MQLKETPHQLFVGCFQYEKGWETERKNLNFRQDGCMFTTELHGMINI